MGVIIVQLKSIGKKNCSIRIQYKTRKSPNISFELSSINVVAWAVN